MSASFPDHLWRSVTLLPRQVISSRSHRCSDFQFLRQIEGKSLQSTRAFLNMQNATTTPAIHLQPLPPSSTAAAPALTLTGQPSLVQPNNNLNNGQSMTSASMPSQPAAVTGARSIWTKITKWLFFFVKVLASLAVLVATYIALSVALWTSVKDFRDDCRSQNVSGSIYCEHLLLRWWSQSNVY